MKKVLFSAVSLVFLSYVNAETTKFTCKSNEECRTHKLGMTCLDGGCIPDSVINNINDKIQHHSHTEGHGKLEAPQKCKQDKECGPGKCCKANVCANRLIEEVVLESPNSEASSFVDQAIKLQQVQKCVNGKCPPGKSCKNGICIVPRFFHMEEEEERKIEPVQGGWICRPGACPAGTVCADDGMCHVSEAPLSKEEVVKGWACEAGQCPVGTECEDDGACWPTGTYNHKKLQGWSCVGQGCGPYLVCGDDGRCYRPDAIQPAVTGWICSPGKCGRGYCGDDGMCHVDALIEKSEAKVESAPCYGGCPCGDYAQCAPNQTCLDGVCVFKHGFTQ